MPDAATITGSRVGRCFRRAAVSLPDRLPLVMLWITVTAAVMLLLGLFRPAVVLPAIAVVVAATWRLTPRGVAVDARGVTGSLLAVVGAATWAVVNLPWASRYVLAGRDPGFLTLSAHWLAHHGTATVPVQEGMAIAAAVEGVKPASGPFGPAGDVLHIQGAKALPGVLATGSWLLGDRFVLAGNLVVGAVGLIALYALGRRVIGPFWAFLPVTALAVSVPMVVFSRAAYTEPLTLALVLVSLIAGWDGLANRRLAMLAVSGTAAGATAMVRIDGMVYAVGLFAGLAVLGMAVRPASRPWLRRAGLAVGLPALAGIALGWTDLRLNSLFYYAALRTQSAAASVGLVVSIAVAVVVLSVPLRRLPLWLTGRRRPIAITAAVVVGAASVFLASRPLWLTTHHVDPESGYGLVISALQERENLPIDGSRSYDEMSVTWLTWYYGIPAITLGFAGLAMLTYWTIRRRDTRLLLLLAVVGPITLIYLWQVSITPDQVWAMRRFLPVTIPGLLLAAASALHWASSHGPRWVNRTIAIVGTVAIVAPTVGAWSPQLVTTVEQSGRLGELSTVCSALGDDPVVFIAAPDVPPYFGTLLIWCDVPTVETVGHTSPELLRAVAREWDRPVRVVSFRSDLVPWAVPAPQPWSVTTSSQWTPALSHLPVEADVTTSTLFLGMIEPSGYVVPLTPAQAP